MTTVDRDGDPLDAAASLAGGMAFVCDMYDPMAVDETFAAVLAVFGWVAWHQARCARNC